MTKYKNLVDILRNISEDQPSKIAYTFLQNGEIEAASLTYQELDQLARAIATKLQHLKAKGERALLLYPPGLEFIAAFYGALYAGVIAIPIPPPDTARLKRTLPRLQAVAKDAQASLILTTSPIIAVIEEYRHQIAEFQGMQWLATEEISIELAKEWKEVDLQSDMLAYLQYTSGSTSTPKGVMVSHQNIIHNSKCINEASHYNPDSISVTWLPYFHDYGLVDGLIQPLYAGIPSFVMSPLAFIKQPLRWLQAISRYRVTHSGGPNFAYDYCVRRITPEQRESLDLSSWCTASMGAEPIRQDTLTAFVKTFGECGFRPSTIKPGYGLAEATLVVSFTKPEKQEPVFCHLQASSLEKNQVFEVMKEQQGVFTVAGCGHPVGDTKVQIVDPEKCIQCAPEQVGEIWISSASVCQGYWNRTEETQRTFQSYLADTGEGPFLRTGDLGFLKNGELFVTGRLKDLIIIAGANHYPEDIELTVEKSYTSIKPTCCAAFSVEAEGKERLVVVTEVERRYQADRRKQTTDIPQGVNCYRTDRREQKLEDGLDPDVRQSFNAEAAIKAIIQAISEHHELQVYAVVLLKSGSIPKTSSGKIQRSACRIGFLEKSLDVVEQWVESPQSQALEQLAKEVETLAEQVKTRQQPSSLTKKNFERVSSAEAIQSWLILQICQRLKVNPTEVDVREPFSAYGLVSREAVSLIGELENWLGRSLSATLMYDYPNIAALAQYLVSEHRKDAYLTKEVNRECSLETDAIAIIGIGCRFPTANNPPAFWQIFQNGEDTIKEVPLDRWNIDAFYDQNLESSEKMSTRWGSFLEAVDKFDPLFFGLSAREASSMDPQQRLLLEVSWEALENAGISADKLAGSQTGVFIGISSCDYYKMLLTTPTRAGTGVANSIAANRLSYFLDLRGPSLAVDTACSSSLVAVHMACQSLRLGESHLALAGGVNVILSPEWTIAFSQAGMMAADGLCKSFDATADGYVRGEGCGVVVLKRLADALKDGDNVLAVIRGSALNQDGRSNGLTAPNGLAQQAVIRQALQNAGVAPHQIDYVEAHGSGTPLGDVIEVQSLTAVLGEGREPNQLCTLSSVKTNIGHLEAAAGIAGLIKAVLCLQHGEIPPHPHLKEINPHIALEQTPFHIPTTKELSPLRTQLNFAGVSAFGFGGTNAHVVLEKAPLKTKLDSKLERSLHILSLSAKTEKALLELVNRYENYLAEHPDISLPNICFTANTGRSHFSHRLAVIAASKAELQEKFQAFGNKHQTTGLLHSTVPTGKPPKIAFLFTGQGSQYTDMARQLYKTQTIFRQALDQCAEILTPLLEQPLLSVLYPSGDTALIDETANAQPALFAVEYALAQMWRSWGIQPDVVMGHSVGEYVAACIAGVFSLEDALRLIACRSRLMGTLPREGEMAAVFAEEALVAEAIGPYQESVAIAAVNGPKNTVISGIQSSVRAILQSLESDGIVTHPLKGSHAFHSPLMKPILNAFEQTAQQMKFAPPSIPMISNLTGELLPPGEVLDASYWCRHIINPVRFSTSMQTLVTQGYKIFLEIGPKDTLIGMGKRCFPKGTGSWLASLKQDRQDWQVLMDSLAAMYVGGIDVNWAEFDRDYSRQKVWLPTYPFEQKRCWLESSEIKCYS